MSDLRKRVETAIADFHTCDKSSVKYEADAVLEIVMEWLDEGAEEYREVGRGLGYEALFEHLAQRNESRAREIRASL